MQPGSSYALAAEPFESGLDKGFVMAHAPCRHERSTATRVRSWAETTVPAGRHLGGFLGAGAREPPCNSLGEPRVLWFSGYVIGTANSGYHAQLYGGIGGSSYGSCDSFYLAGWNECYSGYTYSQSGAWFEYGFGYYSLCGFDIYWAQNTHNGCVYFDGCSGYFYTSAREAGP